MKYALFPGCVLEGAAAEAYTSLKKVCEKLNIKSEGFFMAGLRAPMAIRLMRVGKMNPLDKHPVNPEIETIRKIVKNAEAAAKEAE